jgi:hypothetical protein
VQPSQQEWRAKRLIIMQCSGLSISATQTTPWQCPGRFNKLSEQHNRMVTRHQKHQPGLIACAAHIGNSFCHNPCHAPAAATYPAWHSKVQPRNNLLVMSRQRMPGSSTTAGGTSGEGCAAPCAMMTYTNISAAVAGARSWMRCIHVTS